MVKKSALSPLLLDFFKKYIEIDTSKADGSNYPQAISLLEQATTRLGFSTERVSIPVVEARGKNRIHLVARKLAAPQLPTLLIYNHIDVVPANYPKAYTFTLKNGKAYGRGTSDHKGGTVAVLDALEKVKSRPLRFNLIFWATTDEETDQLAQLHYMTYKLDLPKNTVVFDTDTFAGGVTVARLGLINMTLLMKGKAIHSAMSNLGHNAIVDAFKVVGLFEQIQTTFESQISEYMPFKSSGLKQICSLCNVTMIVGGVSPFTIPDTCRLTVDVRVIPDKSVSDELERIQRVITNFCKREKISCEFEKIKTTEGNGNTHPLSNQLNEIYQHIAGEGGLYCILGSNDLAQWAKENNLPHFGLGVARGENRVHGVDEFVYIKDIENLSQTLVKFLTT